MTTAEQLKELYESKLANYREAGQYHPEVAAQFAVDHIFGMYKNDKYINQLLEAEIEDSIKAGEIAKASA